MRNNDPSWPFRSIYSEISSADISIGNLECVFVDSLITGTFYHKKILFPAYGESVEGLKLAGFDYLSLANNHALDFGIEGVQSTIEVLEKNGITPAGIDSTNPVYIRKKGFTVALFCLWMNSKGLRMVDRKKGYSEMSGETLAGEIKRAGKTAGIVILFIHWGKEYNSYPSDSQKNLAHLVAQAGADIVIGHGPHQMQGIERHGKCLIAYSLGNCVFDQKYEETKIGLVLRAHFNRKNELVDTDILPVSIPEYIYAPKFFEGSEKERIISELSKLSDPD